METVKLTKNELKFQRDSLKRFERYLPTLLLKKQQLQAEIRLTREHLQRLDAERERMMHCLEPVLPLFAAADAEKLSSLLKVSSWTVAVCNVAGTDVPVHRGLEFEQHGWDLYGEPLWLDDAVQMLRQQTEALLQRQLVSEQLESIEAELQTVSQRVNLFEKVKIPDARENIRRINIYIGDQQTNSVGRAKIAKGKCRVASTSSSNAVVSAMAGIIW